MGIRATRRLAGRLRNSDELEGYQFHRMPAREGGLIRLGELNYNWFRLWLSDALRRYKERLDVVDADLIRGETFADRVCQPKLTITT